MATSENAKWVLDASHSELEFRVKHLMISNVKGEFKKFDATFEGDVASLSDAKISATIDASSIYTNEDKRDEHLRSEDFFDVEKFKDITFVGTSIKSKSDDEFELTGDLTMKGITKPVTLNVEFGGVIKDPWGNDKSAFSFSGEINRKDWGLNWNSALEAGGVLVGEKVKINGEVQFAKQA